MYQDLGNTCFTFLSPRESYDKDRNTQIVVQGLRSFGLSAMASGRNDITVGGRKVSGSAFKLASDRAFHHGTPRAACTGRTILAALLLLLLLLRLLLRWWLPPHLYPY